jgi:hypothetical protein
VESERARSAEQVIASLIPHRSAIVNLFHTVMKRLNECTSLCRKGKWGESVQDHIFVYERQK